MRPINSLTDAQPGQIINFLYRGGSTPFTPGPRAVRVENVEDGRVHGYDMHRPEGNNFRQYKAVNASCVAVAEEAPEPVPAEAGCGEGCSCESGNPAEIEEMMRMLGILPEDTPMDESRLSFVDAREAIQDAVDECDGDDLALYYRNIVSGRPSRVTFDEETGELVVLTPERKVIAEISARIGDETLHIEMDNLGKKTILRDGEEVSNECDVRELVIKMGESLRL